MKIYVVEDQEIYSVAYRSIFSEDNDYHLSGMTNSLTHAAVKKGLSIKKPEILLIGVRSFTWDIVDEIKKIRIGFPEIAIVLTFASYHTASIKILNRLATEAKAGMAVFLKQSIHRIDQLRRIIESVNEGHFILDPALTSLILTEKRKDVFLKELTKRELEILDLISEGHSNSAIAAILYIDIKTVRHHINNIYSKLKSEEDFDLKHPRVRATRRYLATKSELVTSSDT